MGHSLGKVGVVLCNHEESSLATDQVVAEIIIQQRKLVEDCQTVDRYAVLDHLLADRTQRAAIVGSPIS
jgi:hypothetical protein